MATSFSIQDILSSRSHSNKRSSPSPSSPSNLSCATSEKSNTQEQQVTVVESNMSVCENKSMRKRSRDYASSDSSISASSSTLEVSPNSADSGSPAPTDLDVHSLIDGRRKSKRPRTAFTSAQLKGLEYYFRLCPYPDTMGRDVISRVTGIDDAKIQVWFQNRRARYRKREQPLKMSPVPPTPSQPHVSHTLHKPHMSPATPKLSPPPGPPQQAVSSSAPPHGMVEMFYAAAMAYQLQQAYQRSQSPTGYIPFPYVLPRPLTFNSQSTTHSDGVQKDATPTTS